MKKTLLLLFTVLIFYAGFSQDVTLTTQAQVDIYAGGDVTGNLTIGPSSGVTTITDLSTLSTITSVTGYLYIYENSNLENLSGLESLININQLYLGDNPELLNINALSTSLTTIGDYFSIYRNPKLTSLSGLSGIISLNFGFIFEGCPLITNFTDLSSLTTLDGTIDVVNTGLTSFDGLPAITTLSNYLKIDNNDSLNDYSYFSNLASIGGALEVGDNMLLSDFTWLSKLNSVGTYLYLYKNSAITSLNGFDLLTSVGDYIFIDDNENLTSLNGIELLTDIGSYTSGLFPGFIQIDDNVKLIDISGIINIDPNDINKLTMRNNTLLSTCEISNICTYLDIPGSSIISGNATGCANSTEILAACATASVSDYLLNTAISIYPNPSADNINIDVLTALNIEHIALYSMQGRLIKEQKYELQSMDMSQVASGIYMLKISSDKGFINARIVKK